MKHLKKSLRKNMLILRKAYKRFLKSENKSEDALRLTDNFHVIEKNYSVFFSMTKSLDFNSKISRIINKCRNICEKGILPDENRITAFFLKNPASTAELRYLPAFMIYTLILYAAEAVNNNPEVLTNSIKSLIMLEDCDFGKILYEVSDTEKILCQDPAGTYINMDEATKDIYRKAVCNIAEKENISETDAAVTALEKAKKENRHIGFYLDINNDPSKKKRGAFLLFSEAIIPFVSAVILSSVFKAWYLVPLLYLPLWEALKFITDTAAPFFIKTAPMPKMNFSAGIPDDCRTVIAVSSLLPSAGEAKNLIPHLKDLYLSNCKDNTCICVLADLKNAKTPATATDEADIKAMKRVIDELNGKYGGKFLLAARPRIYSCTENEYTGYERKRGAITALVKYIADVGNEFLFIHGNEKFLKDCKYIMALDSDTSMPFASLKELVSAAAHPLNKPVISYSHQRVVSGYGIIAPKTETSVASAQKTYFSSLWAGSGGISAYNGESYEKYQDFFGCSIFSGKGLIDVYAFASLLIDRFPDQKILSHDILEGIILRTAFLGSVSLTDSFPSNQISFFKRLHRWIRGDIQNSAFILKRKNALPSGTFPLLGKWWLTDNIRRAVTPAMSLFIIFLSVFMPFPVSAVLLSAAMMSAVAPYFFSALASLAHGGFSLLSRLYFSDCIPYALICLLRGIMSAVMLVQNGICSFDAVFRAVFRMYITKKHLLQWTTAADSEKASPVLIKIRKALPSVIFGVFLIASGKTLFRFTGLLFILNLPALLFLSKQKKVYMPKLSQKEKDALLSYTSSMWRFYENFSGEKDNYLIPDNIQESPVYRIAHRTSPTNIGLMLCSFLAARDLDYISSSELYDKLSKSLNTVFKLEKFKGNLYNWYDTQTLKILEPPVVSTVDSGNFLCCLTALKEGLKEYINEVPALSETVKSISKLIKECDLSFLYDGRRNLFHISYNTLSKELSSSYFDLLMSEARMTSYFAVASGLADDKHWQSLGRPLSKDGRYSGPVSWTGTMFEYFMPAIFLPSYRNTLGGEALKFCIYGQKKRTKNMSIPYGISESGYFAFDRELNYQYKAHGVRKLSLKNSPERETVISPYSTFLTVPEDPHGALSNLKRMEKLGLTGQYGFFEAADFTEKRCGGRKFSAVRSYMAHHIGMSFLSAANALFNNIMQKRFMQDDNMMGAASLLYEKIPTDAKIYKNISRHAKYTRPQRIPKSTLESSFISPADPKSKIFSNGQMTAVFSDSGMNISIYGGVSLFSRSADLFSCEEGVFAAIKQKDNKIIPFTAAPLFSECKSFSVKFSDRSAVFKNRTEKLLCSQTVCVHPLLPAEIFSYTIKNTDKSKQELRLMIYCQPCLSDMKEKISHPAFSKMFIFEKYHENEKILTFTRRKINGDNQLYIAVGFLNREEMNFFTDRESVLSIQNGIKSLFGNDPKKTVSTDKCCFLSIDLIINEKSSAEKKLIFTAASSEYEAVGHILKIRSEDTLSSLKYAASPFDSESIAGIYAKKIMEREFFKRLPSKEILKAMSLTDFSVNDLWATGISGDFPVITVKADSSDFAFITPFIELYKKLRLAGIISELAFISDNNDCISETEAYIASELEPSPGEIINKRGGIFILSTDSVSKDSLAALYAVSAAVYPEHDPENICEEFVLPEINNSEKNLPAENKFTKHGYLIGKEPYLPWSHIIAGKNFGTLLTHNSLGYTWALNSRENKLTPWLNDARCNDFGERLILSLDNGKYDIIKGSSAFFKEGSGEYFSRADGLLFHTRVTVHSNIFRKNLSVSIINSTETEKDFSLSYYISPVLSDLKENARFVKIIPDSCGIYAYNPYNSCFNGYLFACTQGNFSYQLNKMRFLTGSDKFSDIHDSIIITKKIKLPPKTDINIKFYLSFGKTKASAYKAVYITPKRKPVNKIEIQTPDKELNCIFNDFLPCQIISGRINGRTGFYQCGGAFGFRDQLQDAAAVILTNPEILKIQLIRCAAAQFPEGDVLHWFHSVNTGRKFFLRGVRTTYSDDLLWLPFFTAEYCLKTGDFKILSAKIPYLNGELLENGEKDRFGDYFLSEKKDTLYKHCLKAIIHSCKFGSHNLPLIKGGDWNDSFNSVGQKGKGESVWLGMFLSLVMKNFSVIAKLAGDIETSAKLLRFSAETAMAVEREAWDRDRYLRCFYDDSTPMGKSGDKQCEIDILPQAWSVISEMKNRQRQQTALNTAYNLLVDKKNSIVKLFTPPFTPNGKNAGYVNMYPEGIRENGGQYTHGAVWLAKAFFMLNNPNKGYELLNMLNPASKNSEIYKTEPYYFAGDVYSAKGMEGRGGWSLYTGSAGWFYRTVCEDMLGIKMIGGRIKIKPCLPDNFGKCRVRITIDSNTKELIL